MEYIYVDTALLAVPNYAVDDETAKQLIERVLNFSELLLADFPIQVVTANDVLERLWDTSCGPDYDNIFEFLELMHLREFFNANDLLKSYHTVLDRGIRAAEICPVDVEKFTDFQTSPELPECLVPGALRVETERIFSSVAASTSLVAGWNFGSSIGAQEQSDYATKVTIVEASGDKAIALPIPAEISVPVRTIRGIEDFVSAEASKRIWQSAECASDLHFAIAVGALATVRSMGREGKLEELKSFQIGPGFFESLKACQCAGIDRFSLAARGLCVQVVAGACKRKINEFGRPKQEIREFDNASGWRVHLTEGSEGLRLMFWSVAGVIEFANVGVKHELKIDRGSKNGAYSCDLETFFGT